MLRVLRSKTLNINSVADLNENSCGTLPTFFSIYLLTFKTVSTKNFATENKHGIPEIIRGFKTFSARRVNQIRHTSGIPVWQRNYHEHIIRDQTSLQKIRQYI